MPCNRNVNLAISGTVFQIILSVAKEDGSGSRFNVSGIDTKGEPCTVYAQTID